MAKFEDGISLRSLHLRARRPYEEYVTLCQEVETVYRGAFALPKEVEDADATPGIPSEGFSIIDEILRIIVRGDRSYEVPLLSKSESASESRLTKRASQFVRAYTHHEREVTGRDRLRDLAWMAAMRGQAYIRPLYEREAETLPVYREVLDPLECFPVWGRRGVLWYTLEKQVQRWEMEDYFGGLPERIKEVAGFSAPDFEADQWKDVGGDDLVTITEYWDDTICAWAVNDHLVQEYKHGYERMMLRAARFGQSPDRNQRWAVSPILAPVRHDLVQIALMLQKIGNGVEMFYWPTLYAKSDSGLTYLPTTNPPVGEVIPLPGDATIGQVSPQTNDRILQQYLEALNKRVARASIEELEQLNASGFAVSQWLNAQRDRLGDYTEALETAYGQSLGDVLYLHELFDEGQGWDYYLPEGLEKRQQETIKAADIAGHHRVTVTITPSLPSDMTVAMANFRQAWARDPVTGKLPFSLKTAIKMFPEIAAKIPNIDAEISESEWEWLNNNDPQMKELNMARIKAEHAGRIAEIEGFIDSTTQKQERKDQRETERAIERGMSEDVIIPSEVALDPQKLHQFATLVEQGQLPAVALKMVMGEGMPMGVPGQQPQQASPEDNALIQKAMAALQGQEQSAPAPEVPNGLTGYEGNNPMAAPAALLGAEPRMAVDQPNVQIEQIQEQGRRGGLPAPS